MSDDESNPSSNEEDFDMESGFKSLQEKDPDFYKYLLDNDKSLLEFDPTGKDDGAGDSDDDEDSDDERHTGIINVSETTLNEWCVKLRESSGSTSSITVLKDMMTVFRTAVANASSDDSFQSDFKLAPDLFNIITRICFTEMTPGLFRLLSLPVPGSSVPSGGKQQQLKDPSKCKNWKAVSTSVRKYLLSLIQVMNVVSEESVVCSLLRHSLHMIPFIHVWIPVLKKFVNRVTDLWSSSKEKVRVLAFLCVVRLIRDRDTDIIDYSLKKMYLSFAKNCRLTTTESMPMISFMQQSLVELYSLDQSVAYNHIFVFLRQCAITLRNAMSKPLKENMKMVFCWPYIHSLILWQKILCCLHPSDVMKPLIYPLVQVMTGAIKLSPSTQFEPLRFHIIQSMMKLSQTTGVFIPVIPFVVNILERVNYPTTSSKKAKSERVEKKVDFNCLLRVVRTETGDKWYRDFIIKTAYDVLLDYFSGQSHRIGFPELAFPPVVRVRFSTVNLR